MKKKIISILAIGALAVLLAPVVSAACLPEKVFSTANQAGVYNYVYGANGDVGTAIGAFWEPANRINANEGTLPLTEWFKVNPTYSPEWYILGFTGDARVFGCPAGQMAMILTQDNGASAEYAILQADETGAATTFYFNSVTFQPLPRPRVTNSSKVGTDIIVDLAFDSVEAGYGSFDRPGAINVISDLVLYSAQGADPGRAVAAGWTEIARVPYASGETTLPALSIDCSGEVQTYIAAGLVGTGEFETAHVGASTVIGCDPTLADPDDKFDIIRDRGQGQKKGTPFRDR